MTAVNHMCRTLQFAVQHVITWSLQDSKWIQGWACENQPQNFAPKSEITGYKSGIMYWDVYARDV